MKSSPQSAVQDPVRDTTTQWLRTQEAAKILHVHPDTLRKWVRQGKLEGNVRTEKTEGGHTRFLGKDLIAYKAVYQSTNFGPNVEMDEVSITATPWSERSFAGKLGYVGEKILDGFIIAMTGLVGVGILSLALLTVTRSTDGMIDSASMIIFREEVVKHMGSSDLMAIERVGDKILMVEDGKTVYVDKQGDAGDARKFMIKLRDDISGPSRNYIVGEKKLQCNRWKNSSRGLYLCEAQAAEESGQVFIFKPRI
jgi:excisionase family DNA binding protein